MKNTNKSADLLDVKIERIVPDGYGLAFAENLTVFVPLVAPGDLARVRLERRKGKIAFAELVEILEPSPDRAAPPCPYFGRCGGCDFQQLNYQAQLRAKVGIVKDALRRIGKIDWQDEIKIVGSPNEWNYRTRAQWKHRAGKLGYFERDSHRVADVAECPILTVQLQQTLSELRKNESFDFAEAQAVAGGDGVSLRFERAESSGRNPTNFDENFYAANKREAETSRVESSAENKIVGEIKVQVGNFDYSFDANCFFQVNHRLLPDFVETAIGGAAGRTALDLYCGVGLFALPLAEKFNRVVGVEGNAAGVSFARKNAAAARLANINFEIASVGVWIKQMADVLTNLDFVMLDPPRTGAEPETIETLCRLQPAQIAYVSCNPATLARDLRILIETGGCKIEKITAFDFFPQTHHVEIIVRLSR